MSLAAAFARASQRNHLHRLHENNSQLTFSLPTNQPTNRQQRQPQQVLQVETHRSRVQVSVRVRVINARLCGRQDFGGAIAIFARNFERANFSAQVFKSAASHREKQFQRELFAAVGGGCAAIRAV